MIQPIHTVYGGAHLFRANTAQKIGQLALKTWNDYAPNSKILSQLLDWKIASELEEKIHSRILSKLNQQAVEDFRIDFEDGFGSRPDPEEDHYALQAAQETALGLQQKSLPPQLGIRIKALSPQISQRALRTLQLYLTELVKLTHGILPAGFVVTLPKAQSPTQITDLTKALEAHEEKLSLPNGIVKIEIMVESPEIILNSEGKCALPNLVRASKGRCRGAHFGAYDYTSALGISASHQGISHSACDFARHVMQVSLAGSGITLSDGANHVLPIGPHRSSKEDPITPQQFEENRQVVHKIWRQNYELIRRSLIQGFYQGWDLHPAQIPIRYAAFYLFFLEELETASTRLKSYLEKEKQAGLAGQMFDDAASIQGLLNFFSRGQACGALTDADLAQVGLIGA